MKAISPRELADTEYFQLTVRDMGTYNMTLEDDDLLADIVFSLALHEGILASPSTIRAAHAMLAPLYMHTA